MRINITNIDVDDQTIDPALRVSIEVEYFEGIEAPISVAGRIILNGKTISSLQEIQIVNDSYDELIVFDQRTQDERMNGGNKFQTKKSLRLTSSLSPKAIEHIEESQERSREKSVDFQIEFILKSLNLSFKPVGTGGPQNTNSFLKIKVTKPYEHFTIKQSDWINHYTTHLGIGKFLLFELSIPNNNRVPKFWEKLYGNLVKNLVDIEHCLKSGDWQNAMFYVRKFYENIKIGDGKPGHNKFKQELDKILKDDQHGDEGIKNLYDALWQFFEFASKYIHDNDKQGNINNLPIPHKEDAYFAYSLAIGILNFIGRKLARKT